MYALVVAGAAQPLTRETASSVDAVAHGLSSARVHERVWAGLQLMHVFFRTDGKLGFLTPEHQGRLQQRLLEALDRDEATASAAVWALVWLTGARVRTAPRAGQPEGAGEGDGFVLLEPPVARKIEALLRQPSLDPFTYAQGMIALTRQRGLAPVFQQDDWMHRLAVIADGVEPRRHLPRVVPSRYVPPRHGVAVLLQRDAALSYVGWTALSMGSLGVYEPEMVVPLRHMFESARYALDVRDEAFFYLVLVGTPEAVAALVRYADTPPDEGDDYLYIRGLFGLLLLDDVGLLAEQLRKALPHSDLHAYAYGLAGSRDPRGRALLEALRNHEDSRIREAVAAALSRT